MLTSRDTGRFLGPVCRREALRMRTACSCQELHAGDVAEFATAHAIGLVHVPKGPWPVARGFNYGTRDTKREIAPRRDAGGTRSCWLAPTPSGRDIASGIPSSRRLHAHAPSGQYALNVSRSGVAHSGRSRIPRHPDLPAMHASTTVTLRRRCPSAWPRHPCALGRRDLVLTTGHT